MMREVEAPRRESTGFWREQEAELTARALADRLVKNTGADWRPRVCHTRGFYEAWADCGAATVRQAPDGTVKIYVDLSAQVSPGKHDPPRAARYTMRKKLRRALDALTTLDASEVEVTE